MRILHVSDTYLPACGGIEVMVSQLAAHQREQGHQVRVVTRTAGPECVDVVRDARQLDALLGWADVTHCHLSLISPLATRAACESVRHGLPTVASVHSMWTGGEALIGIGGRVFGWRHLPIQWAPVSQVAARSVRHAMGPGAAIKVLGNAIDTDYWGAAASMWPSGASGLRPVTMVSVGRMAARKRPLAVVAMLEQVRRLVPSEIPLRAVLVGDGPLRSRVARAVERRGMDDWVEVPGALPRDQVRDLYARSDISIGASRLESFGLASLEARTAGLAVVARRGTGVEDFMCEPIDGLLATSDAHMAAQLARLVIDDALRQDIQRHNRTVRPSFDWDELLHGAESCYRQAAALQLSAGARRELLSPVTA